jgi:tetratricopeptide (TPR) repeat protein
MAEVVDLPPLDASAARNLARLVAGAQIRADALEILVSRAAGNPLYLEQLVRAMRETGALSAVRGGDLAISGLTGGEADLARIPTTVAAAVRARIEILEPPLKEVLSAAAVIGELFWAEGVARMLGRSLEDCLEQIDRLIARDLIRWRSSSRYQNTRELEFTHGAIRGGVLARLKRSRRRELERAAVAFLEWAGETDAATLASHKVNAGWRHDAAKLYAAAARRSVHSGDFGAAGALISEGLLLVEGGEVPVETHAELLWVAARAFELGGELEEADHALELLLTLRLEAEQEIEIGARRARIALALCRFPEARRLALEASERAKDAGLDPSGAAARVAEAEAAEASGDDRAALKLYIEAQPQLGDRDRPELARLTAGLARIAMSSGDYRTAEGRFRGALVHARAAHDIDIAAEALVGLGDVARRSGEAARAVRYFDAAERVIVDPSRAVALWARRALLAAELGDLDGAERQLAAVAEEAQRRSAHAAWILAALAWAQLWVGFGRVGILGPDAARAALDRLELALSEARRRTPSWVLALEVSLSHLLARAGEPVQAFTVGGSALGRFEASGSVPEDEPARVFLVHAYTLDAVEAPNESRTEARIKAVQHLDLVSSRLDRSMRERYLARPLAKAVLDAAARAALVVERDPRSHRLTVRTKR